MPWEHFDLWGISKRVGKAVLGSGAESRKGSQMFARSRQAFCSHHHMLAGCHDVLGTGLGGHSGDEARSCLVRRGRTSRDAVTDREGSVKMQEEHMPLRGIGVHLGERKD